MVVLAVPMFASLQITCNASSSETSAIVVMDSQWEGWLQIEARISDGAETLTGLTCVRARRGKGRFWLVVICVLGHLIHSDILNIVVMLERWASMLV